jgi:flagellar basal body-associated protein FliL
MSNNDEMITCLECGEEVHADLLDEHMNIFHSSTSAQSISKAQQRLQARETKTSNSIKIIAGVVLTVILLVIASLFVFIPQDDSSGNKSNFQETEEQPNIVNVPNDNNNDGSGDPGSGDNDPNQGNGGSNGTNGNNNGTDPDPVITALQISTDEITTNAKWYPFDSDGVEIRFFAVRSNDAEIHVAFDACDVCYDAKLGYKQDGVKMECNNCGKSFPIKAIGTENIAGGCWPSYLPMTIEDENVVIKISDLEEKKYMFE